LINLFDCSKLIQKIFSGWFYEKFIFSILVFTLFANYMINYNNQSAGLFFLVGSGLGYIDIGWEERSESDESLGTPLPDGGSRHIEKGSSIGFILDFGFWILDFGFWILDFGFWILDFGF
jgi:hypothetical protein